jgi:type I restriction enzyme S subunit
MSSEVAVEMYGGRWKKYPTYRDSGVEWIGEVPEEWDLKKIRHVVKSIKNGTTKTQVDYETKYRVTRIETISNGEIDYNKIGYVEHNYSLKPYCLDIFDILLSHINSLEMVGNCALYEGENKLYGGMNLLRLRPENNIEPRFLLWWLKSTCFLFSIRTLAKHAINQVSVPISSIKNIALPCPNLPEQRAIAAFLDRETGRIDTLIEKKGRQVELLQEKRAALISHTVTKGLDPDVPMKDSGVEWRGEVPEHWKMLALKRLVSLKSGDFITSESIDKDGDYPVFGGNGLRGYTTTFTHDGNYVLIGRQGALCGNINYAQGQFWASEHAVVVLPIGPVETKWLGELLRTMNLNQYSVSAAQPGLSVEMISNLSIPQPPLQEQRTIAASLNRETGRIDTLTTKLRESISKLREYRTALISAAVTGKIDVREDLVT